MKWFFSRVFFLFLFTSHSLFSTELPWFNGENLTGSFVQEKHLAALSRPFVTKGQYIYTVEYGLIWHTLKPVDNKLIINQQGISEAQADGSLKILTSDTSFSALLLPIFSADPQSIKEHFNILESDNGITLTPINPQISSLIQNLDLVISDQALQQITLNETNGNLTHIFLQAETTKP